MYGFEVVSSVLRMRRNRGEGTTTPSDEFDYGSREEGVRTVYTALAGLERYPTVLDYARRDLYELLRDYYRPRVETLVSAMRSNLVKNEKTDEQLKEYLDERYREITEKFIRTPSAEPDPPARTAFETAQELASHVESILQEFNR